jgi:hypothetical protein
MCYAYGRARQRGVFMLQSDSGQRAAKSAIQLAIETGRPIQCENSTRSSGHDRLTVSHVIGRIYVIDGRGWSTRTLEQQLPASAVVTMSCHRGNM